MKNKLKFAAVAFAAIAIAADIRFAAKTLRKEQEKFEETKKNHILDLLAIRRATQIMVARADSGEFGIDEIDRAEALLEQEIEFQKIAIREE